MNSVIPHFTANLLYFFFRLSPGFTVGSKHAAFLRSNPALPVVTMEIHRVNCALLSKVTFIKNKYYKLPVQTKVPWNFSNWSLFGGREFGTNSVLAEGHLHSKSTGHLRKCARTVQPNYNYCHLPLSARNSYGAIRLLLYYGHMPLSAGCS